MHPPPTITTSALRFIGRAAVRSGGSWEGACPPFPRLTHAQQVATEDLLDVRLRVPLLEQRVGELRQLRRVLHADRHRRPVEIRSEPDMVDARDLHRVVD